MDQQPSERRGRFLSGIISPMSEHIPGDDVELRAVSHGREFIYGLILATSNQMYLHRLRSLDSNPAGVANIVAGDDLTLEIVKAELINGHGIVINGLKSIAVVSTEGVRQTVFWTSINQLLRPDEFVAFDSEWAFAVYGRIG